MDEFFSEIFLKIADESGNYFEWRMRPLKIKELPQLFRISSKAKNEVSDIETLPNLIDLINQTIDGEIENLPEESLDAIIDAFIELNFGKEKSEVKKKDVSNIENELGIVFDFLISQGHNFSEILEYTLPQFLIFQKTAIDRLTGYKKPKKASPFDILGRAGVKVRHK